MVAWKKWQVGWPDAMYACLVQIRVITVCNCTKGKVCTTYKNLSNLREKGLEESRRTVEIQRMLNKGLKHRKKL